MSQASRRAFRDDVVAVAQRRKFCGPIEEIAEDFRIFEGCLQIWLRLAEIEVGRGPGTTATESAELREMRTRKRLLEQENEVLPRAAAYLSQANSSGKGITCS